MEYFKKWTKAAGIRALRTAAQAAIGAIGTSTVLMSEVNWTAVASTAFLSGIVSILMAISGLPELEKEGRNDDAGD